MPALCRDCLNRLEAAAARCPRCRSPRVVAHDELFALGIAHVDCDSFYASVEKRDNPALRDVPLIVGGGARGVVTTCCYIARLSGVRSAMPMFEALRLCPGAQVVRPRMQVYAEASRNIRALMERLTPLIEPLSLDEAFLDLTGTERLHGAAPAEMLVRLARQIEAEVGVSVSVGLSYNKFLAKIASDLDKPRGLSVVGRAEAADFLAGRKVGVLWGVGVVAQGVLEAAGIRTIADLRSWGQADLVARFGGIGARLWHLARGEDHRPVLRDAAAKSISKETTFEADMSDAAELDAHLWRLSEQVSERAKARGLEGHTVTLKLKRADHRILTRRVTLPAPTQMADTIWRAATSLLVQSLGSGAVFRLIGVGISGLAPYSGEDPGGDLFDRDVARRLRAERAVDAIRAKFGPDAILRGRSLR